MNPNYLLLCLLLYAGHAFGQLQVHPNKPLPSANEAQEGKVYITYRTNDSTDLINIFLINRSQASIQVFGINRRILFIKEAINEKGEWQRIDEQESPVYCATGYGNYQVPTNTYTWQHHYANDYAGSFETQMRFSIRIQDSLIVSAPIPAKINYNLFLEPLKRTIKQIDEQILNRNLTDRQKRLLELRKAQVYFIQKDYPQSINICQTLLQQDSQFVEAKYFLALALIRIVSKSKDLSEAERYGFLSAVINLCQDIPKKHKNYDHALKLIEVYTSFLPTREQWEVVNDLDCGQVGNEYQCFIEKYFNATTIIRYKD